MRTPEEILAINHSADLRINLHEAAEAIRLAVQEAVEDTAKILCDGCRNERSVLYLAQSTAWGHPADAQNNFSWCQAGHIRAHFKEKGYLDA